VRERERRRRRSRGEKRRSRSEFRGFSARLEKKGKNSKASRRATTTRPHPSTRFSCFDSTSKPFDAPTGSKRLDNLSAVEQEATEIEQGTRMKSGRKEADAGT
jgi:hypothetical protein